MKNGAQEPDNTTLTDGHEPTAINSFDKDFNAAFLECQPLASKQKNVCLLLKFLSRDTTLTIGKSRRAEINYVTLKSIFAL